MGRLINAAPHFTFYNPLVYLAFSMFCAFYLVLTSASYAQQSDQSTDQTEAPPEQLIYKSVRPDGTVEFSDRPETQDAEAIEIKPSPNYKVAPRKRFSYTPAKQKLDEKRLYKALNITQPANDSQFRNPTAPISLSVAVTPRLQYGHKIKITGAGSNLAPSSSTSFSLPPPHRGSHTLTAQIINAKGKVLMTSPSVTIHVQKNSVLNRPK